MKKIYYAGISALCLLCIACRENNTSQKNVPVKVKVQKVEAMKTKTVLKFSGTVEEENGTVVSFPVGGTLSQIPVSVGCYVAQGQLLASVDPSTMKNTYDAAQATLAQAQDAYTRMKQLYEKGSLPEIQWVEVQSKLQQAESMEHIAKKNLEDCHIYAPFSGIIAEKFMEIGQNAAPGIPVAKLVQITQVKIKNLLGKS